MYPVLLDLERLPIILAGEGEALHRRYLQLAAEEPSNLKVFAPRAGLELSEAAGERLHRGWPGEGQVAACRVLFLAGAPPTVAAWLTGIARRHRVLVNVEDDRVHCDFHSPARIKRGDLLITVSTNGKSPGLARRVRLFLERSFTAEWSQRLAKTERLRTRLRAKGASMRQVMRATDRLIDREGWLPPVARARDDVAEATSQKNHRSVIQP